jgi:hypothetical protein
MGSVPRSPPRVEKESVTYSTEGLSGSEGLVLGRRGTADRAAESCARFMSAESTSLGTCDKRGR